MRTIEGYKQMSLLKISLRVLCLVSLLLLVGCEDRDGDSGLPFSHRHHIEDEELTCENCHKGADKGNPTKPTVETCMKCHKGLDEKKPVERRLASYLVNGQLPGQAAEAKAPSDIKFSHQAHLGAKLQCVNCHKDVAKSKSLSGNMKPSMKDCVTCHSKVENVNVKNNCAYCHKTIRRDVKPEDHKANWKQLHGKAMGFLTKDSAERCETCHTQEWCFRCHRQEKPRNHNNYWKERGHTIAVDLDRQSCKVCHNPEFCIRCHRAAAPDVVVHSRNSYSQARCVYCHYRTGPQNNSRMPPHRSPGFVHCLQCHRIR